MTSLVTIEDERPVYNPEARTIKEFRVIIERDKGSKGDNDGRKKLVALKELAFVYFICDYRSPFKRNTVEEERIPAIKEAIGLPDEWKPDKIVEEAIAKYQYYQETQTMRVLDSTKSSLFSTQEVIMLVERRLKGRIDRIKADETLLDNEPELLDKIISDGDRLSALAKKIPDQIDTINKLEEKVRTELESEQFGRAGRKINRHELPD